MATIIFDKPPVVSSNNAACRLMNEVSIWVCMALIVSGQLPQTYIEMCACVYLCQIFKISRYTYHMLIIYKKKLVAMKFLRSIVYIWVVGIKLSSYNNLMYPFKKFYPALLH